MKTILYLSGAGNSPPPALGANHTLLAPPLKGDPLAAMADLITREAGGSAHIVAEGDGALLACRLALDHPVLVTSLVLSAPAPADAALLPRLAEITAPCLLLQASKAAAPQQAAMEAYQQRLPRATRILFYGDTLDATPAWTRLVADFIDRGEQFVVNAGGES